MSPVIVGGPPAASVSSVRTGTSFWSLTAYLPRGNTLVPNAARKYEVARFTPGLVTNPDGSITIYLRPTPPPAALRPNWLPIPRGPSDVLLRVYGPDGNTGPGAKYIPPKIQS